MIRSALGLLAVSSLIACELRPLDGVVVRCAADDECPKGQLCAEAIGRCVGEAALVANSVAIDRAKARAGDVVVVTFDLEGDDSVLPLVQIDDGPIVFRASVAGAGFSADVVVDARLASGGHALKVLLGNSAGEVEGVDLGSFVVDNKAPVPLATILTPFPSQGSGPIEVDVAFDDDDVFAGGVVVQLTDVEDNVLTFARDGGRFTCAAPDCRAADLLEGEAHVFVSSGDDVGNASIVDVGVVTIDRTAPTVSISGAPVVQRGAALVLVLTADEQLAVPPVVIVAGIPSVLSAQQRVSPPRFTASVATSALAGPQVANVDAADQAGNAAVFVGHRFDVVSEACTRAALFNSTECTDADHDGFFADPATCGDTRAADCDDTRVLAHPGATEIPFDGVVDNDCDGAASDTDGIRPGLNVLHVDPQADDGGDGSALLPLNTFPSPAQQAGVDVVQLAAGTLAAPNNPAKGDASSLISILSSPSATRSPTYASATSRSSARVSGSSRPSSSSIQVSIISSPTSWIRVRPP